MTDELVVGDASDASRFINTTSHPDAGLDEARALAAMWHLDVDPEEPVQEVRLTER